jgi:uncharacterized ubiquitin-like protein YukD
MDDMVTVDIRTPQNEILQGSYLPLDYSIRELIDELIDSLALPRLNESAQPIAYMLRSSQQNRTFGNHETVLSAQIRNNDTLELQSLSAMSGELRNGNIPPPPNPPNNVITGGNANQNQSSSAAPLPPTVLMSGTSEINVVLSVMDLNRHETVSMPVSRPVGDLIRQIVENYGLPSRDNLNQLIKYKLQSKALGRFLDERLTLLEAQIPPLDRLTLHRDEIAG